MSNLRFVIAVCFSSLLVWANAQDDNIHEENVIAAIDPATEVRLGTLQQNELVKKYHLSTNHEYIEAVNRVGRRVGWTLDRTADFPKSQRFTFGQRLDNLSLDCHRSCVRSTLRESKEAAI